MASEFSHEEAAKVKEAMAQLSLAAEEKEVESSCLSDEDLALLVDDFKAGKDLTRFKDHLSSCSQCYDRWMSLVSVQLAASLRPEGKVHFLPGLLKQRYLGSALAVAAAIALFLNIYEPEQLVMQPPSQKSVERKAVPTASVESDAETPLEESVLLEKPAAAPESPSPASSASPETKQKKALPQEQVNDTFKTKAATATARKKELKSIAPAPMQPETQSRDAVVEVAARRKQSIARDVEESYQKWFTKISYGCQKEQNNEKYWQARQKEWRRLQANTAQITEVPEETMQKAATIAAVLQETSEENIGPRCEEILEILAEKQVNM